MRTRVRYALSAGLAFVAIESQQLGAAPARIAVGADASPGGAHVKAFTARTLTPVASFFAYPSFSGGVRVAVGDVNGDGAPDLITGSGPGAAHVKVFSGRDSAELHNFLPYGSGFTGGIFVASGDVNGDGRDDIVIGPDTGVAPHVKVFSGASGAELHSFFAYPVSFTGGVRVAAGDVNGDGRADIITGAGPGGSPHVKVLDGGNLSELHSFFAFSPSFAGGVFVAAGDVNGDGRADIVAGADAGAGPQVKALHGATLVELHSFFAYDLQFSGGVRVATGDLDGDGRSEIITAPGPGTSPLVRVFHPLTGAEKTNFFAFAETFTGGVHVGAAGQKRPVLEIFPGRAFQEVLLRWPAGCLCELEANPDLDKPEGWQVQEVKPVEADHRLQVEWSAPAPREFFRLRCDDEAVRPTVD